MLGSCDSDRRFCFIGARLTCIPPYLSPQFNVEGLEGQSFDLFPSKKSKTDEVVKEVKMDGRKFALRREVASLYECVRPVVTSSVSGAPCVGPAFSSVFNVTEKIALKIASTNTPLPVRDS
jgi:hypothetical protein